MSQAAVDNAGVGHNRPPQPLDPALLLDWLEPELETLRARRKALLDAVERFKAGHLPIRDDEEQGSAAEFVRQLRAFMTASEELRERLGRPYLDCTSTLNTAFKRLTADVTTGRETVDQALTAFALVRAEEERQRREAVAAEQKRVAELAERQARQTGDDAAWDRAVDTAARSEKATRKAAARPADLSRVRGDMGAVASLREHWAWEVIDADAVPREYCTMDARKVRAAIAAGTREITGLRIFNASTVAVR